MATIEIRIKKSSRVKPLKRGCVIGTSLRTVGVEISARRARSLLNTFVGARNTPIAGMLASSSRVVRWRRGWGADRRRFSGWTVAEFRGEAPFIGDEQIILPTMEEASMSDG